MVIVVTGVTFGLGRALVEGFADQGHTVWGNGRTREPLAQLQERFGAPHDFACVDVTDELAVARWAERAAARVGPADILINNAALINRTAALWEISAAELDRIVDVNLKGVCNVLRHFVPAMVQRRQGVIVNLSSGWGRAAAAGEAPYCATKWAVEGLTKALAQELPEGMAAVPLNPGIIHTRMLETCFGASAASSPTPAAWARSAVPYILGLGPADNGRSLTVP